MLLKDGAKGCGEQKPGFLLLEGPVKTLALR